MKISFGTTIVEGPFGGGNLFLYNLIQYLKAKNYEIVHNLEDNDIDLIILTNPLMSSLTSTFDHNDILYYQKFINPNSISLQRINECDERKNTNHVNKTIVQSNKHIDITIFVSNWLKNLYLNLGIKDSNTFVIRGGPNTQVFNNENKTKWNNNEKLKIVTHHWSSNWMKGFDSYVELDNLLSKNHWNDKVEFTYIGNLPKNFNFKNTIYKKPMNDKNLAAELKKNHIYITGSLNEPSGNHHMEAALCGLPILYINSGGIPEFCKDYGVSFENNNLEKSLIKIIKNYEKLFQNLTLYPYSFQNAAKEFDKIVDSIALNKKTRKVLGENKRKLLKIGL